MRPGRRAAGLRLAVALTAALPAAAAVAPAPATGATATATGTPATATAATATATGATATATTATATAATRWTPPALWSFADRRQADVEPRWQAGRGTYMPVGTTDDVRLDANMLAVHAAAATAGHRGAARRDDRVLRLADLLTRAPAFLAPPGTRDGGQGHVPGWSSSSVDKGAQHVAIDPQVATALAAAWQARNVVGMPEELRARIVTAIRTVADSGFFRYPAMLLNQFNWHADMALAAYDVTGEQRFLTDYRRQLVRFVGGTRRPLTAGRTAFLNAGLGLIYSPRHADATGSALLSASEYENLVFSGLRHYDRAVAAGMAPLGAADERRLRAWGERVLFGDWTHAGTLNWDTSLGTRRWHLGRYWAFALQGAETLATANRLRAGPEQSAWSAWVAGRALETYDRLTARERRGTLPSGMWGIAGRDVSPRADPALTASRFSAHAARLATLRPALREPTRPPGWFAHDPDAGRLAVSTTSYSTAVLLRHPTEDLGGIELARLFDGAGEPVSGTGGSGDAAFGLALWSGGRVRLDTQPGRAGTARGLQRLRATQASRQPTRGTLRRPLTVRSSAANASGRVDVEHVLGASGITVRRTVRAARDATATVRLPVWGAGARVWVVRADGRRVRLGGRAVGAERGDTLLLRAAHGGYRVGLCRLPVGARLLLASVPRSATSPATRRVVRLRFAVPAGAPRRLTVRLQPTAGTPSGRLRCGG